MKDNAMKKQMTKKSLKQHYALGRSEVGLGRNLGTRNMKSPKDYNRKSLKAATRKEYRDATE